MSPPTPACRKGLFLNSEHVILQKINQLSLAFFSPGPQQLSFFQALNRLKLCSPDVQDCDTAICLFSSSQEELLRISSHGHCQGCPQPPSGPRQLFLVCKYQVQQSNSHHPLLAHLCQEVVINALQKSRSLFVSCCIFPPGDIMEVGICHKDNSLQTCGLNKASSSCSGGLQQTLTTTSPKMSCSLILT